MGENTERKCMWERKPLKGVSRWREWVCGLLPLREESLSGAHSACYSVRLLSFPITLVDYSLSPTKSVPLQKILGEFSVSLIVSSMLSMFAWTLNNLVILSFSTSPWSALVYRNLKEFYPLLITLSGLLYHPLFGFLLISRWIPGVFQMLTCNAVCVSLLLALDSRCLRASLQSFTLCISSVFLFIITTFLSLASSLARLTPPPNPCKLTRFFHSVWMSACLTVFPPSSS